MKRWKNDENIEKCQKQLYVSQTIKCCMVNHAIQLTKVCGLNIMTESTLQRDINKVNSPWGPLYGTITECLPVCGHSKYTAFALLLLMKKLLRIDGSGKIIENGLWKFTTSWIKGKDIEDSRNIILLTFTTCFSVIWTHFYNVV